MRNPAHEEAILKSIEELNFCVVCGKDLNAIPFDTCNSCGRSTCGNHDGNCCEEARQEKLEYEAAERVA